MKEARILYDEEAKTLSDDKVELIILEWQILKVHNFWQCKQK